MTLSDNRLRLLTSSLRGLRRNVKVDEAIGLALQALKNDRARHHGHDNYRKK